MTDATPAARWFPVAASDDLPLRHVYHAQLLGQELAVWRADDGYVNVWENRCLHRGVRLSLGHNLGDALKCQYHGWTYASRSSACTYIPAHPDNAPARLICNKTFAAVERHGLVWSSLGPETEMPAVAGLDEAPGLTLRSIPVHAAQSQVIGELLCTGVAGLSGIGRLSDMALSASDAADRAVVLFVQPCRDDLSVIRGIVQGVGEDQRLAVLHHFNDSLSQFRSRTELLLAGDRT